MSLLPSEMKIYKIIGPLFILSVLVQNLAVTVTATTEAESKTTVDNNNKVGEHLAAKENHRLQQMIRRTRTKYLMEECTPMQHTFDFPECIFKLEGNLNHICCASGNKPHACHSHGYPSVHCDCVYRMCRPGDKPVRPTGFLNVTLQPRQPSTEPTIPQQQPIETTEIDIIEPPPVVMTTPTPPITKSGGGVTGGGLKCYSCESTQGDSSVACKDNPASTKVVICKKGYVCRTVTYISEARGGSVIIRGCADPNDHTMHRMREIMPVRMGKKSTPKPSQGKPPKKWIKKPAAARRAAMVTRGSLRRAMRKTTTRSQSKKRATTPKSRKKPMKTTKKMVASSRIHKDCVVNPVYLPDTCDPGVKDCGYAACGCSCSEHFCNSLIYPGQGWNACL